ncbi:acyl-CoA dehydrogenase family protein [Hyphobacterium sp. HN65]|uniref:Acyl-CoA dehydrogenase family protein n=1 Tax=Hyphobacterium lacteum TaxID=3116575 RepID=A0ABU7LSD7_9PROT|nr:acyl-CoA dehydrogenase family protein [Hyphobacterium sp. HN65]MEE2526785.1 acyl-CoA dehydrogenase family protein [Hyphobacterium sp. HN65]
MENPFDTEERRAFRETVRRFVADEITPYADAWDEAGEIPWELHQKVGALGVFGFGMDERWGGLGFSDCFMQAAWAEELAQCGVGGVAAALGGRSISQHPIQDLANDDIRDRVLPEIISGRKASSLAITEPAGGSDVGGMKTTARREGGQYVINGQKTFITGGMKSDYFVVGARTAEGKLDGISLFFVEADAPGFSRTAIDRKMGWWCSDQATLYFEDCRIPADNLLGKEGQGFLAIVNNFNGERIGLIASMLGAMKLCLKESISWAMERETFGKPLIRHQVIRHKIADMSAKIDMVEAYLNQICWLVNEGRTPVAEISKAKFSASKALEFCASETMQILGGAGYLRGHPVERVYREVKVQAIGGGSEEIMRDLAVRQMGL